WTGSDGRPRWRHEKHWGKWPKALGAARAIGAKRRICMGKGISRRALLQGLGAAALAAPLLGGSRWRRAEAAPTTRPRRLVVLFTPHGAPAEFFWPKSATDLTAMGAI